MRLIDADDVIQFSFSYEAGTNEWIDDLISKVGLSGKAVNFDLGIEEKAQELCKKVIDGMLNIIQTSDTAYDIEKVIEEINMKSFDYYTGSGAAIDVGDVEGIAEYLYAYLRYHFLIDEMLEKYDDTKERFMEEATCGLEEIGF